MLLFNLTLFLMCICAAFSDGQYLVTDQFGIGRRFDGIGGLSGGGATSKLLVNYKEPERSQILDYLFKPNFGASLQILKVEIGGDDQSTDGTEASHMHEEWEQNYNRGYEWWLMKEAKKRNPNIKLWGLSWAWPHWLGNSATKQPYNNLNKTAMYTINWIRGAKAFHNLTIDYIGIWNEKVCNFQYLLTLKQALINNNLTTEIVACDGKFREFYELSQPQNQQAMDSIYAFGVHYPGTQSPLQAIQSNKTLWSSEDFSTYNDDVGAGCWARTLNQNYVNGYFTSTISWNLIASYYFNLPYQGDGLMTAVEPWSGYYEVKNPIWISAHTTQFTEIGWNYLVHNNGVGHLNNGGSYVAITSPDKTQLTLIIETVSHDHSVCIRPPLPAYTVTPQSATFKFAGSYVRNSICEKTGLQNLFLWKTQLNFDGTPSSVFQPQGLVPIINGVITLNLDVDQVYTLTTVNSGNHGDFSPPPASSEFPLPYEDNFQSYSISQEPYYLTPQVGSWEVLTDSNSQFARQTVAIQPVPWCFPNNIPFAVIGNGSWTDMNITASVRIPSINGTDLVFVGIQVQISTCQLDNTRGIYFWIQKSRSSWQITTDLRRLKLLTGGLLEEPIQTDQWYTLSLSVKGNTLKSTVNGIPAASYTLANNYIQNGFASIGSGSYGYSDIKYLSLSMPS